MKRVLLLASLLLATVAVLAACGGDDDATTTATVTLTVSPTRSPGTTASPTASATPTIPPTDSPAPTERPPHPQPAGFPIDPATRLGVVTGPVGSRALVFDGSGPAALDYALNDQPSDDPERANRSGWNCRTHFEYESIAALDFYIPTGTPILSTMDGTATLYAISYVNDFDRYGVSREPYLGDPDRSRAPYSPFPGPSSGLGVYVVVQNEGFVTEYGHLDLGQTVASLPDEAFINGYRKISDYAGLFAEVPQPRVAEAIAQWTVRAGDIVGLSGDAGYSEGPHLHYTIQRTDGTPKLCPTTESAFPDNGWLFP